MTLLDSALRQDACASVRRALRARRSEQCIRLARLRPAGESTGAGEQPSAHEALFIMTCILAQADNIR